MDCWVFERAHDIVGTICLVARGGGKKPHWLIESIAVDVAHLNQDLASCCRAPVRAEARLQKVRSLATQCSPRGRRDADRLVKARLH